MLKKTTPFLTALLVSCAFSVAPASAQNQTGNQPATSSNRVTDAGQRSASSVSPDLADLSITANVRARELRFEAVPNPTVKFTGNHERRTVWDAERQNLPRPVQPGVTYRDIGIRLTITSVFADIDRIVAEALGEVPTTGDAAPGQDAQPKSSATPMSSTPARASSATTQPKGAKPQ